MSFGRPAAGRIARGGEAINQSQICFGLVEVQALSGVVMTQVAGQRFAGFATGQGIGHVGQIA